MRQSLLRLAFSKSPNGYPPVPSEFTPADLRELLSVADTPPENIQPGQHWVSICKSHDIYFADRMKLMKGFRHSQPPYKLFITISQQHCMQRRSMRYFDKFEHPFAKSMLKYYIDKKEEPLWMYCSALGGTAYPNKKASKKMAHALRDALAEAGYDRVGRPVLVEGQRSSKDELYGSLSVTSSDPVAVCNAAFTDLMKQAKIIVSSAQHILQRDKYGRQTGNFAPYGGQPAQQRGNNYNKWR
ncbi:hypothetical protein GGR50DRAFT_693235 [Xylaria sp. CBS 124048]|nr:hypothetical protein GGR50DRAFT_693235 [Xylaria sp. CBS 124048]